MKKYLLVTAILFLLFNSCKDNPTNGNGNTDFSVEVQVVNSSGTPLPNINVSIWDKIYFTGLHKMGSVNQVQAVTSIRFEIPEQCYVDLSVFDLNGELYKQLVSKQLMAGAHVVDFSTSRTNGVYICRLTASPDSLQNEILFKDSIYAVEISPAASYSLVGKTGNDGSLIITNKLLFPYLYNLPSIPLTNYSPQSLNNFSFSDSVVIALSDESFSRTISYEKPVTNGKNKITLQWNVPDLNVGAGGIKPKDNLGKHRNWFGIDSVGLISFSGIKEGNKIILNWSTAFEVNNLGFGIEKMNTETQSWNQIGFIHGNGTTNETHNYSFTDDNPVPITNNYRLKQIDYGGIFHYSVEVVVAYFSPIEWKLFQNYPNPFN